MDKIAEYHHVVAFIDILGTSQILCGNDEDAIRQYLMGIDGLYYFTNELISDGMTMFSDNIVIYSDVDFRKNEKSLYPYLKRYNFQKSNCVLDDFSDAIKHGDKGYINSMMEVMPEEMKTQIIMKEVEKRPRRFKMAE